MSYGIKASRNLIKTHARWFDLSHYESLTPDSPLELWYRQFALRIDLHRMRSLLMAKDHQFVSQYSEVHSALVRLVRERGVIDDKSLDFFRQSEPLLYPEEFSTLNALRHEGQYVRPMTLGDHLRLMKGVKEESMDAAIDSFNSAPFTVRQRSAPKAGSPDILSELLSNHLQGSACRPEEAFLRIDLRLPRALITKQVEHIVDGIARQLEGYLPPMKETKMPTPKSWYRSKVLPYIDLQQWIDEPENHALREELGKTDMAEALRIDPQQLGETTIHHASELTDHLSWTFIHLTEATIQSLRDPLTPLRKTKRTKPKSPKN